MALLGAATVLLALVAGRLDGALDGQDWVTFWRSVLTSPVMAIYTLLLVPLFRRLRNAAIGAYRPMVALDDGAFQQAISSASMFDRQRERLALLAGAPFVLVVRPWEYSATRWLSIYAVATSAVMYAILGWFIYSSLAGTALFSRFRGRLLQINAFELKRLEPIASWSLGVASGYLGGITLSVLLLGQLFWRLNANVVFYGTLILAAVWVFYLNMRSTHQLMVEAKERELALVRDSLVAASEELREHANTEDAEATRTRVELVTALVDYEEKVERLPEWPYTARIQRNLLLSAAIPSVVGVAQSVLLERLQRALTP
jgi:hypothetical protein